MSMSRVAPQNTVAYAAALAVVCAAATIKTMTSTFICPLVPVMTPTIWNIMNPIIFWKSGTLTLMVVLTILVTLLVIDFLKIQLLKITNQMIWIMNPAMNLT